MKELKSYFRMNKTKPTPWAIINKIAPSVISRYLNGNGISPKNALKIEQATGGQVTVMELLYPDQKQPTPLSGRKKGS